MRGRNLIEDIEFSNEDIKQYKRLIKKAEQEVLISASIVLCTCLVSGSPLLCKEHTDDSKRKQTPLCVKQLIIDECGQCTEPESMVPIVAFPSIQQVVLIGDHMQLQPIVINQIAKDLGLEISLFERYHKSQFLNMLTQQYRMHEAIASFPSEQFYEGKLRVGHPSQRLKSSLKNVWPNGPDQPMVFCHVEGSEQTSHVSTDEGGELSKSNRVEVDHVIRITNALCQRHQIAPKDIAVLTQYRAQMSEIDEKIKKGIKVSTVITSQGSEWDYVILSTVRSLPESHIQKSPSVAWCRKNLGFITDDHQLNVAITRARKGLIIIGNKNLLQCHKTWRQLIHHYAENKKVVPASEFLPITTHSVKQKHPEQNNLG